MTEPFDFDRIIDRRAVPGDKWDRYADRDVLPLWVADMDFAAPPAVLDALRTRVEHGVFGYAGAWPSLVDAVVEGVARDHDWHIEADWLVWLPGVVTGLNLACRAVAPPGTGVFTATPVYPPFLATPANNGCRRISVALEERDARWAWNRPAVEAVIDADTRLFLLCNPHNPVGRVFDDDELEWIVSLAERHDFTICTDEIHCGLVLDPAYTHRPLAALSQAAARRSITLMAPSKTWNIPALYCAFAIIPDEALRRRFRHAMRGIVPGVNVLGMVATETAYRDAHDWRLALLEYLAANAEHATQRLNAMPGLATTLPEATYLSWVDCRGIGQDDPTAFFEAAGVGLSDGAAFGMPGFVRLNFGCPRATLDAALDRMQRALQTG
ncbi:MAG: putative C-S lyase [Azoarcus sp.]|nr:putative C-S lyase [Azoarcus sp.]